VLEFSVVALTPTTLRVIDRKTMEMLMTKVRREKMDVFLCCLNVLCYRSLLLGLDSTKCLFTI
jgi:hypothetical protein